jgi:alkanesulfonate monooxygenase SsuD/methylene tetrahydromethanopterin reductase-like flavin-dependent oxidoreductase (luciferase family)
MKIGMTLPQRRDDGKGTPWEDLRELALLAEAGGAESLWVADHFLYRDESTEIGLHEAFTLLTAVAAVTSKVSIGPLVACTSFRSAGMLAKIAATLDAVSGGRLILGLGCGWHEAEYNAFGYPFDHRVGRFEEVVAAVRPLLHGERVSLTGQWTALDDAVIVPKPEHQVPLLIASNGPRMLDITARFADAWQAAWFGAVNEQFRTERAALLAACEAAGRSEPLQIFAGIDVNEEEGDDPHLPCDAAAIADALAGWAEEGVDHVQLRVHPGTKERFETAIEGITRFRA